MGVHVGRCWLLLDELGIQPRLGHDGATHGRACWLWEWHHPRRRTWVHSPLGLEQQRPLQKIQWVRQVYHVQLRLGSGHRRRVYTQERGHRRGRVYTSRRWWDQIWGYLYTWMYFGWRQAGCLLSCWTWRVPSIVLCPWRYGLWNIPTGCEGSEPTVHALSNPRHRELPHPVRCQVYLMRWRILCISWPRCVFARYLQWARARVNRGGQLCYSCTQLFSRPEYIHINRLGWIKSTLQAL